jgi:hypothetical protein
MLLRLDQSAQVPPSSGISKIALPDMLPPCQDRRERPRADLNGDSIHITVASVF